MMHQIITKELIARTIDNRKASQIAAMSSMLQEAKSGVQLLRDQFESAIEELGYSSNAFVSENDFDFTDKPGHLPNCIGAGMILHPVTKLPFFPAVLPFTSSHATGFCVGEEDDQRVTDLMQMLAFRILLSIPIQQVQFHFIDLHSFGKCSKHFNRLPDTITANTLINDSRKLSLFITELESLINSRYHDELTEHNNLREFLSDPAHRDSRSKYHFVFFPRIDDRIDRDIHARIYSLCAGMNATTCGIYFFYSINGEYSGSESTGILNNHLNNLYRISTIVSKDKFGYKLHNSIFGQEFEERYSFEFSSLSNELISLVVNEIHRRAREVGSSIISYDKNLEAMMADNTYWQGNTTRGIVIPIGRRGSRELDFTLANGTQHFFAMIGGRPGMGKTVLLHNIICNGSLIYSPQEIEYYLIDCTNGTSFAPYEHLPHARFISITNRREYADSAIDFLAHQEMIRRSELFKDAGEKNKKSVENLEEYRETTGQTVSRIVLIIDEFQVLLERRDKLSRKISDNLLKLIKEGRKYGMHIIFCTQSFTDLDLDTNQINYRIAFALSESDSRKILGNDSAAYIAHVGEAIINDKNGLIDANITFQGYYTKKMPQYVSFCSKKWEESDLTKHHRFVYNGKSSSNLGDNSAFVKNHGAVHRDFLKITTYIGTPMFIREEHSSITFENSNGSHLLICGSDERSAVSTIALINYQISCIYLPEDIKFHIFISDFFPENSEFSRYIKRFAELAGITYLKKREFESRLLELNNTLNERIKADESGILNETTPIFYTISYAQNAPELNDTYSEVSDSIRHLLKKGPDYGIHLIIYCINTASVLDIFQSSILPSFGNFIIFRDGAFNMDIQDEVDKLLDGTALLITADRSTTYDRDPVMIYNDFNCDITANHVIKHIFSLYK